MDLGPLDINMSVIYIHCNLYPALVFIKCWKFWYDTSGNIWLFWFIQELRKVHCILQTIWLTKTPFTDKLLKKPNPWSHIVIKQCCHSLCIWMFCIVVVLGLSPPSFEVLWTVKNHHFLFQEDPDCKFIADGNNPFACWLSISRSINDFCLWYLFLFAASAGKTMKWKTEWL